MDEGSMLELYWNYTGTIREPGGSREVDRLKS
jgi:hypothetical protein